MGTDMKFLSRIILELEKDCSGKRKRLGDVSQVSGSCMCKLVVLSFFSVVVGLNLEPFMCLASAVPWSFLPNTLFLFY